MNKIALRKFINISAMSVDKILGNTPKLFVLSYHSISTDGWRFSTSPLEFTKQMTYLSKYFSPVTIGDIQKHISGEKSINQPSFAITFDDGYKDVTHVKSICKKLNIKPCVFVLSNPKKANRKILGTEKKLLNKDEIVSLKKDGWDIGCHSATHSDPNTLNSSELKTEIVSTKRDLENQLHFKVNYFSYPKSIDDKNIIDLVKKAGYSLAFTVGDSEITPNTNPYLVPRIGVDASHSFSEFKSLFMPATKLVRKILRTTPWGYTA